MNKETGTAEAQGTVRPHRSSRVVERDELDDALHRLAQPMTALMFVLEMARMQTAPEAWRQALDSACNESARAMKCLEEVRGAAARKACEATA